MKTSIVRLLTVTFALSSILVIVRVVDAFKPPALYKKDFVQFYLMAKALKAGLPVYAPLPELAERFDPSLGQYHWHPSAYPPSVLFLVSPLSNFSYRTALIIWDGLEVLCLLIALFLIVRHFGGLKAPPLVPLVAVMSMLWPPFYYDLYHGQIMMLSLLIITVAWLSLRRGKNIEGGVLLGLLLAIKLYAWPISLLLLIKRNYSAFISATATFLIMNAASVAWLGKDTVLRYYFQVAPQIGLIYRNHPSNFSAMALGSDLVAPWFGIAITLVILACAILLSLRVPDFDHAFMIMLSASVILGPVSWQHYFVTLLPAFCLVASWQRTSIAERALIAGMLYISVPEFYESTFNSTILRLMPIMFVVGLMLLIARELLIESRVGRVMTTD